MIRYFVLCGSVVKSRVVGGIPSEALRRKDDVVDRVPAQLPYPCVVVPFLENFRARVSLTFFLGLGLGRRCRRS